MSKFCDKFKNEWPEKTPYNLNEFTERILSSCAAIKKPNFGNTTVAEIIDLSSKFPIKFGTDSCRINNQPEERHSFIRSQLASAYPIIHERVLYLYIQFLEHKSRHANKVEKDVYKELSLTGFVQRLLTKRAAVFCGPNDLYLLMTGEEGHNGWDDIGTKAEKPPLVLKDLLSYEEIKLSALLSISSHSEFLNNGTRRNCGIIELDKSKIELDGVVIGLIGARLCRRGAMEYQDIIISKSQNIADNGYGQKDSKTRERSYRKVWKDFYEEPDFLYKKVTKDGKRFGQSSYSDDIFDNLIMKRRFAISFDTLLLESEARAAAAGKRAYIHVVGIGLGVWRTSLQQEEIFLLTFTERLKVLMPQLSHVAFVHFSWFSVTECGELKHEGILKSETHPDGGIRTFLANRNPADKLQRPEHENTLVIESYAWDGNALPGNEFWLGSLDSSGDPAAACSTLITEIHNPHINSKMVCGENLHIASPKYGVLHIAEYCKKVLNL